MSSPLPKYEPQDPVLALLADHQRYSETLLKITPKGGGEICPLILNPAQLIIHNALEAQLAEKGWVRAIILKGRQQGSSTYVGSRFFRKAVTSKNTSVAIMTQKADATTNLFEMVKGYYDHLPEIFQPTIKKSNKTELDFQGLGSKYRVHTAGAKATGRSATGQLFHCSEYAFWQDAKNHMAGIGQIVGDAPGTEIIIESTGNGYGNDFYRRWRTATLGLGDYIPIFVPYFIQEEYRRELPDDFRPTVDEIEYYEAYAEAGLTWETVYWRRQKIETDFSGDEALFGQEYPAHPEEAFQRDMGQSIVRPLALQKAKVLKPDLEPIGPLIMAVDPAEKGQDASAIAYRRGRVCFDTERFGGRKIEGEQSSGQNMSTMALVGIVVQRMRELKPDYLVVDAVGLGIGVHDRLVELGYSPIKFQGGARPLGEAKTGDGRQKQYVNWRSQTWGRMADWINDEPCQIPDKPSLLSDISAPTYDYDSANRVALETKKAMRARGIDSPDEGDALAMTFAIDFRSPRVNDGREDLDEPEPDF